MLKMKRLPEFADKGKDGDDYQSPVMGTEKTNVDKLMNDIIFCM
jgi:hypothetical protein